MNTTLYLTEPGTMVRYRNESLVIVRKEKTKTCRLGEVDLVLVLPGVQFTDVAISKLLDKGIETIFLRQDGNFRGRLQGDFATNPAIRMPEFWELQPEF